MELGIIMMGSGVLLFVLGVIRWILLLFRGPRERRRIEALMREKY